MTPSVGRIVHYQSFGTPVRADGTQAFASQCRAAIVTEVGGHAIDGLPVVSLCVLNPSGQFFDQGLAYDENKAGGTWHWPERVEDPAGAQRVGGSE